MAKLPFPFLAVPFNDLSRPGCTALLRAALLLAWVWVWVCGLALSGLALAQGVPEQRLALVIGNAAYKASPLTNPVNDA
ncbi:MAG: hypothetical protein RLZZ401_1237, partial [Pseudomonadota bacterium]